MKKVLILLILSTVVLVACTRPDTTRQILEREGYKQITITGYRPFSCSDGDQFKTGFKALNKEGYMVAGTVCSGFLKGHTIRFD